MTVGGSCTQAHFSVYFTQFCTGGATIPKPIILKHAGDDVTIQRCDSVVVAEVQSRLKCRRWIKHTVLYEAGAANRMFFCKGIELNCSFAGPSWMFIVMDAEYLCCRPSIRQNRFRLVASTFNQYKAEVRSWTFR